MLQKKYSAGTTFYRFLDFINRKYLTMILKIKTISINCTEEFCYRHGIFKVQKQPPEVFLKVPQYSQENTCARVSFFFNFIKKETPTQVFYCEISEIFENTFFASDCFSKYESLYTIAAVHSCLINSCSENIWKKSRSISASDCNLG